MSNLNCLSRRCWLLISAIALVSGCGDGGSGVGNTEKWLHAADAQNNFRIAADIEALESKSGPADKSCPALLERAHEVLKNPVEAPSGMKVLVSPCNSVGLEFSKEVRCESGMLQVKCL